MGAPLPWFKGYLGAPKGFPLRGRNQVSGESFIDPDESQGGIDSLGLSFRSLGLSFRSKIMQPMALYVRTGYIL
jgi:hypothetical protein